MHEHRLGQPCAAAPTANAAGAQSTARLRRDRGRYGRCGHHDGDTVVWGTDGGDTVVWGTGGEGETVVWGTRDGETVVWGTVVWCARHSWLEASGETSCGDSASIRVANRWLDNPLMLARATLRRCVDTHRDSPGARRPGIRGDSSRAAAQVYVVASSLRACTASCLSSASFPRPFLFASCWLRPV